MLSPSGRDRQEDLDSSSAAARCHLLKVEEGFGYFHTRALFSPSGLSGLPSPTAVSMPFIPLNAKGSRGHV